MNSSSMMGLFLSNELRLFWRAFQPKNEPGKLKSLVSNRLIWMVAVFIAAHIFIYEMLKDVNFGQFAGELSVNFYFLLIFVILVFYFVFVVSTNVLAITNNFFQLNNYDLMLTAPVNFDIYFAKQLFSGVFMNFVFSCYFLLPLVDMLIIFGGIEYIKIIPAAFSLSACGFLVAMLLTLTLYQTFDMRATARAVRVGVPVLLLLISLAGQTSRLYIASLGKVFGSDLLKHFDRSAWYFLPVRAFFGEGAALWALVAFSIALFVLVLLTQSDRYNRVMLIASGQTFTAKSKGQALLLSDFQTPRRAVWRKEVLIARRSPFMMQQFFSSLIPIIPAFMSLGVGMHSAAVVNWPGVAALLGYISCLIASLFMKMALLNEGAVDLLASSPISEAKLIRYKLQQTALLVASIFFGPIVILGYFSPRAAVALLLADITAFAALSVIYIAYRGNTVDMPKLKQKRLPIWGMFASFAVVLLTPSLAFLLAIYPIWALVPAVLLLITLDLVVEPESRRRSVQGVFGIRRVAGF